MQEVIDLSEKDQRKLWEEVRHICRAVRSSFEPGLKLNIAAIGNVVCTFLTYIAQLCSCILRQHTWNASPIGTACAV